MNIFDYSSAKHFCSRYSGSHGTAAGSIRAFASSLPPSVKPLREGGGQFEQYRDNLLCDADRWLFFAASNYRRSLDLMLASAAPWAHVTLYYSSYYAAASILAMFGGYLDPPHVMVDVAVNTPGVQEVHVKRRIRSVTTYIGTHQMFWDVFYKAAADLQPWVPANLSMAITPISSDPVWQISARSAVNYDTSQAAQLVTSFKGSFVRAKFPTCLPGKLNTQFQVSRQMLEVAFRFARELKLKTDGLRAFVPSGVRKQAIEELIFRPHIPNLSPHGMKKKLVV